MVSNGAITIRCGHLDPDTRMITVLPLRIGLSRVYGMYAY